MMNGTLSIDNSADITSLLPGVYFVQVTTESGYYTAKMIKQ